MNWTELLKNHMEHSYKAAEGLVKMVDEDKLNWKPATGSNWMTTGQLLKHLSSACGGPTKGFVTGDWGLPAGADPFERKPEQMLPSAESLPTLASVPEALQLLQQDRKTALEILAKVSESDLASRPTPAPWDPTPMNLGARLLTMASHLDQHKAQLFYYLKLQGKPVNTMHYFGMM